MVKQIVPDNAVAWGSSMPAQLERLIAQMFVRLRPKSPVFLPEFDSTTLPDPAAWRTGNIYVTDKGCNAVSDGVAWVRPDGSAL